MFHLADAGLPLDGTFVQRKSSSYNFFVDYNYDAFYLNVDPTLFNSKYVQITILALFMDIDPPFTGIDINSECCRNGSHFDFVNNKISFLAEIGAEFRVGINTKTLNSIYFLSATGKL